MISSCMCFEDCIIVVGAPVLIDPEPDAIVFVLDRIVKSPVPGRLVDIDVVSPSWLRLSSMGGTGTECGKALILLIGGSCGGPVTPLLPPTAERLARLTAAWGIVGNVSLFAIER